VNSLVILIKQMKLVSLYIPGIGAARFRRPTFVSTADPNTLEGSRNEVSICSYRTHHNHTLWVIWYAHIEKITWYLLEHILVNFSILMTMPTSERQINKQTHKWTNFAAHMLLARANYITFRNSVVTDWQWNSLSYYVSFQNIYSPVPQIYTLYMYYLKLATKNHPINITHLWKFYAEY